MRDERQHLPGGDRMRAVRDPLAIHPDMPRLDLLLRECAAFGEAEEEEQAIQTHGNQAGWPIWKKLWKFNPSHQTNVIPAQAGIHEHLGYRIEMAGVLGFPPARE